MTFTEIKKRNANTYYYRARSIRDGTKVKKKRIYLGANLSKKALKLKEASANYELNKNIELEQLIAKIRNVLVKNKVKKAGLFGSFAKGKQSRNSDIDILIKPPTGIGFGFAGIEKQLEKKIKRKVDLVSYDGLSPFLKKSILSDEVKIL